MRIAAFRREDLVCPDLAAPAKPGELRQLCAGLARGVPGLSAPKLTEALIEREKLGSTGIGEGVAIPHGKIPGIPGLLAAFGRKKAGVDFASIDGKPTHLFFVLFAPENSAGVHLKALARISRLFKQPGLRKSILEAEGGAGGFPALPQEDAEH